jgi:hypothetical protein
MNNFRIKLFTSPIIVIAADYLTSSMVFSAIWQPASVGIFFAFVSYLFEQVILRRDIFWMSNVLDFLFAAVIVYASQFFFSNVTISLIGALFSAAMLAAFEYIAHSYLLRSGQV